MTGCINAGELANAVGTDLAALVEAQDSPLASCTEVTALPSPVRRRSAYRLELADGTRLKGRRLESPERAENVERLRRRIGPGYARILDRRGEALLLEWVEGRCLASLDPIPAEVLRHCGRLLGALHRVDAGDHDETLTTSVDDVVGKLERNAGILERTGTLEPGLLRRVVAIALENRPQEPEPGIIHKDFCAENIVLDTSGAPVCIDNAKLAVGPLDLDLAMAWYRWPMSRSARAHFASGYEEHRSMKGFLEHFWFWAPCVLLGSASTRLRARVGGLEVPLERLLAVLEPERGHEEHPFWRT